MSRTLQEQITLRFRGKLASQVKNHRHELCAKVLRMTFAHTFRTTTAWMVWVCCDNRSPHTTRTLHGGNSRNQKATSRGLQTEDFFALPHHGSHSKNYSRTQTHLKHTNIQHNILIQRQWNYVVSKKSWAELHSKLLAVCFVLHRTWVQTTGTSGIPRQMPGTYNKVGHVLPYLPYNFQFIH